MLIRALTKVLPLPSLGDPPPGHPPRHDHRAGDGGRAPLPAHPADGSHCGGAGTDPTAHPGDKRWVGEELNYGGRLLKRNV